LEDLDSIYSDPESSTIFDYDLNDPNNLGTRRNMLKCAASLKMSESSLLPNYSTQIIDMMLPCRESNLLRNFIKRQGAINECNSVGIEVLEGIHGVALFLFGSLFNHSCDPNIINYFVDSSTVLIIDRPVKAGEQLFICYR
jgi:hypothetical protein